MSGDTLLLRAANVSGTLWPRLVLKDPYGTMVADETRSTMAQVMHVANATGTYTVQISDGYNGNFTGEYALYAQRTRAPGGALPAEVGGFLAGSINTVATMNAYTLTLQAGDSVFLRATRTVGNLWPTVRLYDPNGNFVNSDSQPITAEVETTVSVTGNYTILVGDGFNGTYIGEYNLYVQRLNTPAQAQSLSMGQTVSGAIAEYSALNTYTFAAQSGDALFLRLSRSGGLIWPMVRLYGPSGQRLENVTQSPSLDLTRSLPATGVYTLLIGDGFDGTKTGFYSLFAQILNSPANTISLGLGQTHQASVNKAGAFLSYTVHLEPTLTPKIALRVRKTSGTIWPLIRLYDPEGVLLAEARDTSAPLLQADIPVDGDYLVLVGDGFNGTATGQYVLEWAFTIPDLVRALRSAGGLDITGSDTFSRMNAATGDSPERIDLRDVSAIARSLSGL